MLTYHLNAVWHGNSTTGMNTMLAHLAWAYDISGWRVTNTACTFETFSPVGAKCMDTFIAPRAHKDIPQQLLAATPTSRQRGCGCEETHRCGSMGLRVVGQRGGRHLILGIYRIRVCGTETLTVPGATLLGGTAHLSGPNSGLLVLQVGDARRYSWKPAPVASGFGAWPHSWPGGRTKTGNKRAKRGK